MGYQFRSIGGYCALGLVLASVAVTVATRGASPATAQARATHGPLAHTAAYKRQGTEQLVTPEVSKNDNEVPEKYRPSVALKARDDYEKERGYHFSKIVRGNKSKKLLALT